MKQNFTLLYVEDDPIVQENFTEIFKEYFTTVFTTDDGNEALDIYEKNSIDVAILDISIKGINGINVATKIRENTDKVLILMLSAYSDREKLLKAVNLNLSGYLIKPVSLDELDRNLQNIFKQLNKEKFVSLHHDFFWNLQNHYILYKNKEIKLTKNETAVIKLLIKNRNTYMNSSDIQEEILPTKSSENKQNNIVQLLSRLRKKILTKYDIEDYFVENCYGLGYRIMTHS